MTHVYIHIHNHKTHIHIIQSKQRSVSERWIKYYASHRAFCSCNYINDGNVYLSYPELEIEEIRGKLQTILDSCLWKAAEKVKFEQRPKYYGGERLSNICGKNILGILTQWRSVWLEYSEQGIE